MDITDIDDVQSCMAGIAEKYGSLDIMVNSAALCRNIPILETSLEVFRQIHEVNVLGTFIVTQTAGRIMARQGKGKIINIGSCSGKKPCEDEVAYGSSKLAVIGITQVAALELGQYGVRCNVICPGSTDSEMLRANLLKTPEDIENYVKGTALRRLSQPRDQANVALFLASDMSDHLTGVVLVSSSGEFFDL